MKPARAWQRMLSGRRLDLLDPTPVDIEIQDIAHGLSFVARWNGQTNGDFPYSVAEHSLLVERIFSELNPNSNSEARLAALLHDAPEYVLGDLISPVKAAVGYGYENLDDKLTAAIHRRFGLPTKGGGNAKKVRNDTSLQEDLDKNMETKFDTVLQKNGHASQNQKISLMKMAPLDIIFELKYLYKRPRP